MSRPLSIAVVLFALSVTRAARADDADRAERLFREAMDLTDRGEHAAACPKLAESQRLDPALGTEYNLALCYEKTGRLGSAYRHLRAVVRLARATGKRSREESALRMLEEVRARVAHLVLSRTSDDVTVTVDGERVDPEEQSFFAVDAGEHLVVATAPSKDPWSRKVTVAPASEVRIAVPVLAATVGPTRIVTITKEGQGRRALALGLGTVGFVGLATAVVTGILILDDKATADERCANGCRDDEGRDAVSRGQTLVPINAIAFGVGALGLGLGAYFFLTSPKAKVSARVDGTMLRIGGTF